MRVFQTTYRDREGKQRTAGKWYVEFRWGERVRRLPAFTDKRASEAFARQLDKLTARRTAGEQPDRELSAWLETVPVAVRTKLAGFGLLELDRVASAKPARAHLDDYERALRASGATPVYVQKTVNRVRAVLDGTKAVYLSQLTGAAVADYLADRRAGKATPQPTESTSEKPAKPKPSKPISAKSSNHYLAAVKGFLMWLVKERRTTANPLAHLTGLNARADRKHVRRSLETDEVRRLLAVTPTQPSRFDVTGTGRYWLYRLAVETGLRSNELRCLTRASFDLDGATVTIDAASAKNRRAATLPLRSETAEALRPFLAGKHPAVNVFRLPRPENVVKMLRGDLRAAGIDYRDDAGRVADFHSLRVTFATMLLRSGVDVRTAKELMRHATINMTADVYACTLRGSLNEAVKKLPDFAAPPPEAVQATGTETADPRLALCLALPCAQPVKSMRDGSTDAPIDDDPQPTKKTGTYDAPVGISAQENAGRFWPAMTPPRGLEPLSSG